MATRHPKGRRRSDDADAFLPDPQDAPAAPVQDDFAESLGEGFVDAATRGGSTDDEGDEPGEEELGGPFVPTTDDEEMAQGTDASNPPGATREPRPRAVAGTRSADPDEEPPSGEE
jgi:hypothetical protein